MCGMMPFMCSMGPDGTYSPAISILLREYRVTPYREFESLRLRHSQGLQRISLSVNITMNRYNMAG